MLEALGNAFRLELPEGSQIHPVINAEHLRKAAMNPLPGQVYPPLEPLEYIAAGDKEYVVERILDSRY